jgi:hypothetical protein
MHIKSKEYRFKPVLLVFWANIPELLFYVFLIEFFKIAFR